MDRLSFHIKLFFTALTLVAFSAAQSWADDLSIFEESEGSGYNADADLETIPRERLKKKRLKLQKAENTMRNRCFCAKRCASTTPGKLHLCRLTNKVGWSAAQHRAYYRRREETAKICCEYQRNNSRGSASSYVKQLEQLDRDIERARIEEERELEAERKRRVRQKELSRQKQEAANRTNRQKRRELERQTCLKSLSRGSYACECNKFDDLRRNDADGCIN